LVLASLPTSADGVSSGRGWGSLTTSADGWQSKTGIVMRHILL